MFLLSGAWIFGVFLAVPLFLGVAVSGKRFYRLLVSRGMEPAEASTTAVVMTVLTVAVMCSPALLPLLIIRLSVSLIYLYFIYTGTRAIIGFLTGDGERTQPSDK